MNCPACRAENADAATTCSACGTALAAPTTSMVVTLDLSPGALFHSRYEILGQLGRGGMGMVYKARDRTLEEDVAIKILRPDFAEDPRMAQRFKSEIKLARKVRHKNVCTIHDFGEERGVLFISMELIEGVDLKRIVKARGGLPTAQAYEVSIQIAEGLQAVHDAGIIHRDLKTPNIMLDPHGGARLMDFGVAKREDGEGASTATGHVLGTPDYMSPEQAQGQKVDYRTDIYALGIVVYELFSGRVPFRGDTPISTILKQIHDPPPLDDPDAAGIPRELRPILRKALAKAPADRYASAADMAEALRWARLHRAGAEAPTDSTETPTLTAASPLGGHRRSAGAKLPGFVKPAAVGVAVLAVGAVALFATRALLIQPEQERSVSTPLAPSPSAVATVNAPAPPPSPETPVTTIAERAPTPTAKPAPPATPRAVDARPRPAPRTEPTATADPPKSQTDSIRAVAPETQPASPPASPAVITTPTAQPRTEEGTGWLQAAPRPYGDVYVDGKLVGTWPIDRVALPAGEHRVRFEHPSYDPYQITVQIRAGETSRLGFDFTKDGVRRR